LYTSIFRFPKNPIIRAVWLKNCGFVEEDIKHNRRLCSSHFEKDSYLKGSVRKILKKCAVPVIFDGVNKKKQYKKKSQESLPKMGKAIFYTLAY